MEQLTLDGAREWIARLPVDPEIQRRRDALEEALGRGHFAALDERVGLVLRDYPETRDSDTELVLRFWRRFQPETLNAWSPNRSLDVLHDLERVDSITRSRRRIQNDLRLFEPTETTRAARQELQQEFLQYLSYQREGDPEIRFYLDESGGGGDGLVGVGGVCIIDWNSFRSRHAAIRRWRLAQGWSDNLHFADLQDSEASRYIGLLQQMTERRAAVLFVAHAVQSQGLKGEALFSLFMHLVVDSLDKVARLGCLNAPRAVHVVKERDAGFDHKKLDRLRDQLGLEIVRRFPERAYLKSLEALPKGSDVLLEGADLIASAVRRYHTKQAGLLKDAVAAAVMSATGLQFAPDSGVVFKIHGLGVSR